MSDERPVESFDLDFWEKRQAEWDRLNKSQGELAEAARRLMIEAGEADYKTLARMVESWRIRTSQEIDLARKLFNSNISKWYLTREDFRLASNQVGVLLVQIAGMINEYEIFALSLHEFNLNYYFHSKYMHRQDEASLDEKKSVAKMIADRLKQWGNVILHPDNGEPCNLYAISSLDGKGRYTLENRRTKKRSNTSKSIIDFLPLRIHLDSGDDIRRDVFK